VSNSNRRYGRRMFAKLEAREAMWKQFCEPLNGAEAIAKLDALRSGCVCGRGTPGGTGIVSLASSGKVDARLHPWNMLTCPHRRGRPATAKALSAIVGVSEANKHRREFPFAPYNAERQTKLNANRPRAVVVFPPLHQKKETHA